MLRLLADENFNCDIVRGILRRRPEIDLVRIQEIGLSAADDPTVLAWAADAQRVVLTHDVNTMTRFALDRIERDEPMSGLFIVHQKGSALSTIIDDLVLLDECSATDEWSDRILYLPLR